MNKIIKEGRKFIREYHFGIIMTLNVMTVEVLMKAFNEETYLEIGISLFLFICINIALKTIITSPEIKLGVI